MWMRADLRRKVRPATSRRAVAAMLVAAGWLVLVAPATAGSGQWTEIGPSAGKFEALAAAPNAAGTVYGVSSEGSVFRSLDAGSSWQFAGGFSLLQYAPRLVVDPSRSTTLFGIGADGLYKSADGGASWRLTSAGAGVGLVAIAASAPQTLYAQAPPMLERSDDGGDNWRALGVPAEFLGFDDMGVDPVDPDTVYGAGFTGIYKSSDGGVTWSASHAPLQDMPVRVIVDPRHPTTIYVALAGEPGFPGSLDILKSTDAGATWAAADAGLPAPLAELALAPSGSLYAVTAESPAQIYVSTDGGGSWQLVSSLAAGVVALVVDSAAPDRLVAATSMQGLLLSADQARTWSAPAGAPCALVITQVLQRPGAPGSLYAMVSSEGFFQLLHSSDGGGTWSTSGFGAGSPRLVLDPRPGVVYFTQSGFQGTDIISLDDGSTWRVLPFLPSVFDLSLDLAADPLRSGHLTKLLGAPENTPPGCIASLPCVILYRSVNRGRSWRHLAVQPLFSTPPGVLQGLVRIDPAHPATLYVGAGGLYKSTNGGTSLKLLTLQGPVNDLIVGPASSPGLLYAVVARNGPVVKSTNGGTTWTATSAGMPLNASVVALVIDPATPATLYAATDQGVFFTDDGAASWSALGNGLPNVAVDGLAVSITSPRTIYAGTRGAGIFAFTRDQ